MKIKKKRNKKILIPAAICLVLGGILGGAASTSSKDELNNAVAKNSEIVSEISQATTTLQFKESEFNLLGLQVTDLESKKESLVKLEEDTKEQLNAKVKAEEEAKVKAKEQARIQAEAKAKAEAQAQAQAKAQNSQASSSTNSIKNNTGGSNGSGGGGSSGTVAQAPSNESNVVKVWKTATGKKYHKTDHCGNTNSSNATLISITEAKNLGLTPCSKCY